MEPNPNEVVNQPAPTSTPTSVVNQENKAKKNKKKINSLLLVLGFIIFGFMLFGLYLAFNYSKKDQSNNDLKLSLSPQPTSDKSFESQTATPTPIDMSDWKTYTDSVNKFTFKYPKDWTEKNISTNETLLIIPDYSGCTPGTCGGVPNGPVFIEVLDNSKKLPLKEFAKAQLDKEESTGHADYFNDQYIDAEGWTLKSLDKSINRSSVFGITIPGACGDHKFFFEKDNKIVVITIQCYGTDIISTFKFTD